MGALTSLLVLAALLASIDASLPQTSYYKYIDIWFFFFIINIALIVFIHIAIDVLLSSEDGPDVVMSMSMNSVGKYRNKNGSSILNALSKIIIPIIVTLFMCVYIYLSISN